MLKIRMQRIGRINAPSYRIIVVEHTEGPKTGNIVEKVGTYNPKSKDRQLDSERILYWISMGAQPSPTVHNMLISAGVITGKKINVLPKKSPPKAEEKEAPAEAAPAADAAATEEVPATPAKTAEGGSPDASQGEESREETPTEETKPETIEPAAEEKKEEVVTEAK